MRTVTFVTHKDGKAREMKLKLAKHLAKAGKGYIKSGAYMTRDMQALQQPLTPPPPRKINATPAAQGLAEELGVDLATVTGSGAGGAITVADVRKAGS